jgi:hypothetical protein
MLFCVSILASTLQFRSLIALNLTNFQFLDFISFFGWPLYVFNCCSTKELICAAVLLYQARFLERLGGPKKYLSSTGVIGVLTTLVLIALLVINPALSESSDGDGTNGFVGPTALIYAQLVIMAVEIPATHQFSLLGLPLSEKLFSYILAFQLIMGRSWNAWIQAVVGLMVGYCYHKNILGIGDFRLPTLITSPIIKIASLITDTKPSTVSTTPNPTVPLANAPPRAPANVPTRATNPPPPSAQQGRAGRTSPLFLFLPISVSLCSLFIFGVCLL